MGDADMLALIVLLGLLVFASDIVLWLLGAWYWLRHKHMAAMSESMLELSSGLIVI